AAEHRIERAAADQIGALPRAARARQRARAIESEHRRERNSRPHGEDARQLPSLRERAGDAAERASDRNLPRRVEDEVVADVEVREPLVVHRIERVTRLEAVVEVGAADRLRSEVLGLAERVRRLQRDAGVEAPAGADDQSFVPGQAVADAQAHAAEVRIAPRAADREEVAAVREDLRNRLVVLDVADLAIAARADE